MRRGRKRDGPAGKHERARALLREAGLAATRVRVACLALAEETAGPVSREEFARAVEGTRQAGGKPPAGPSPRRSRRSVVGGRAGGGKRLDRVTLYRTLRTFENAGLFRRERVAEGDVWCLARCEHGRPGEQERAECPGHMHFECRECGRVECVRTSPSRVEKAVARLFAAAAGAGSGDPPAGGEAGGLIRGARVEAFGVCRRCAGGAG